MIRINLLAAERPAGKKKAAGVPGALQAYLFLALFGGGAAFVCAGAWFYKSSAIRKLNDDIVAAEKRQKELQAIKKQVDDLEAKRKTFQDKVNLIERLKAEQGGPVHMLDEISKALPDYVWLSGMDQAGPSVKFTGEATSLTAVADFISNLQNSGDKCGKPTPEDRTLCWFPEVNLVSSTTAATSSIVTFNLNASFRNPEVAAKEKAAAAAAAAAPPAPAAPAKK